MFYNAATGMHIKVKLYKLMEYMYHQKVMPEN